MNLELMKRIVDGAPEGATHYKMSRAFVGTVIYFKQSKKGLHQWLSSIGWSAPFAKLSDDIKPL